MVDNNDNNIIFFLPKKYKYTLFVDYYTRHLAKFGLHFLTVAWCSLGVHQLYANLSIHIDM